MKSYSCKCGEKKFFGSDLPPRCSPCIKCNTLPGGGDIIEHEYRISMVETDLGNKPFSSCRYCYKSKNEIEGEKEKRIKEEIEEIKLQAESMISKYSSGWTGLNPYSVLKIISLLENIEKADTRPVEEKRAKNGRYIHSIEETKNLDLIDLENKKTPKACRKCGSMFIPSVAYSDIYTEEEYMVEISFCKPCRDSLKDNG